MIIDRFLQEVNQSQLPEPHVKIAIVSPQDNIWNKVEVEVEVGILLQTLGEAMQPPGGLPSPPARLTPSLKEVVQSVLKSGNNKGFPSLSGHPGEVNIRQQKFLDKVSNLLQNSRFYCSYCKELWFNTKPRGHVEGTTQPECKNCKEDWKKSHEVCLMSKENLMDPFPNGYPCNEEGPLPRLSQVQEMLIARVHVIQKVYWLQNHAYGYKGNVLNVEQDLTSLATRLGSLPLRVNQLPIVIICMPIQGPQQGDGPLEYIDFRVHRRYIFHWLRWLLRTSKAYENVGIDSDALND